jgi:plastocyanin
MPMYNYRPGIFTRCSTIAGLLLCFLVGTSSAYQTENVSDGGTIAGTVRFTGPVAKPARLEVSKDIEVCGAHPLYDQSLAVGKNGGVQFAVVTITDISKGEPMRPLSNVMFDQKGCEYIPHVIAFPAGSSVEIVNSDGLLHSIHTVSTINPVVDMAQPGFKKKISVTIDKPEVIKVTCDAHNWMIGWWYVTANPYYAVTDESGHFSIANVPPGTYTVKVWQESLGTASRKVTVKAATTAVWDFNATLLRTQTR